MKRYDPFADIHDKRISELDEEQTERAHELWGRRNLDMKHVAYGSLIQSLFMQVDRLRLARRRLQAIALSEPNQVAMTVWVDENSNEAPKVLSWNSIPTGEYALYLQPRKPVDQDEPFRPQQPGVRIPVDPKPIDQVPLRMERDGFKSTVKWFFIILAIIIFIMWKVGK